MEYSIFDFTPRSLFAIDFLNYSNQTMVSKAMINCFRSFLWIEFYS